MELLTEQEIDWLALEGCEIIGFKSGDVVAYDLAGYDRIIRKPITTSQLPSRDGLKKESMALDSKAQFIDEPYLSRLSGFRRNKIFGPDEIGLDISGRGIPLNDGLGNGLYESLLIDRKFGFQHSLEAPSLGFDLPFLEDDWKEFKEIYPEIVEKFKSDLYEMESIYHGNLADEGERYIVLWCRHYPLALFLNACQRNPKKVEQELVKVIGRKKPPIAPVSREERLALVKFWNWIRKRQTDVIAYQAKVLRDYLGEGLNIIANPHELPPLDMKSQGLIYDIPAVAPRPLLIHDENLLKHYISYFTRLFYDLTEKAPMVSVRMNLSATSPSFVPTGRLIQSWYDQAVCFGAGSFYFWTRDYPTDDSPETYNGPIPGNTDPGSLAKDRWEGTLDVLNTLATHRRFIPPNPEIAIFVPYESALLHRTEWRKIYGVFTACCEAKVYARFIADYQIIEEGIPKEIRTLLVPVIEFVSPQLRNAFNEFLSGGGHIFSTDIDIYDENASGTEPFEHVEFFDDHLFSFFPLDKSADLKKMNQAKNYITQIINDKKINPMSWVFNISCDNLPETKVSMLNECDSDVEFRHWLYEHGSDWITPYLKK